MEMVPALHKVRHQAGYDLRDVPPSLLPGVQGREAELHQKRSRMGCSGPWGHNTGPKGAGKSLGE